MKKDRAIGHILATITTIIWGTTFFATKVVLGGYSPIQILLLRFVLGYVTLLLLYPRELKLFGREELQFFLLGAMGCTLYSFLENVALTYTSTANVGILTSTAPVFSALLITLIHRKRLGRRLWLGFLVCLAGVVLVIFNGRVELSIAPRGDLLSLAAALCWAAFGLLQDKALSRHSSFLVARKAAFYGIWTSIPLVLIEGKPFTLRTLWTEPQILAGIVFLGVVGSGFTFFTWATAQHKLGVLTLSNYMFGIPAVALLASTLVLREPLTLMGAAGMVLVLAGIAVGTRTKKDRQKSGA